MIRPLLADATNVMHNQLSAETKCRIKAFIFLPSVDGWDDICGIIVCGRPIRTIWQAVVAVDPTFPRKACLGSTPAQRWPRVPDALLVARAIRRATKPGEKDHRSQKID